MYDKIDMKKTGILLKRMIKEAGYTVKDIQEILHLSCPQPVYRWYKGLVLPSVDHLYVLSKLLKVHMEDLIVSSDEELNYMVADTKQGRIKERLYEYWTRIQAKQCA